MKFKLCYIGTSTILFDIEGTKIITDPVFQWPSKTYKIGFSGRISYRRIDPPGIPASDTGPIDYALVTHDHHGDHLDSVGRKILSDTKQFFTTKSGVVRLLKNYGIKNGTGMSVGQTIKIPLASGSHLRVTATFAQHGPFGTNFLTGDVIGFFLEHDSWHDGGIYILGDTLLNNTIKQFLKSNSIKFLIPNMGEARFGSGLIRKMRFSMNSQDTIQMLRLVSNSRIIPVHYDGWSHYTETRPQIESAFQNEMMSEKLVWLSVGRWEEFQI